MSKELVKLEAYFTGFSSKVDGSFSLRFCTQELIDMSHLVFFGKFQNALGHLVFSPNEISDEDIPDTDAEDETKSPAQRLRGVLFVLWKARGQQGDFQTFYRGEVERIIDRAKKLIALEEGEER